MIVLSVRVYIGLGLLALLAAALLNPPIVSMLSGIEGQPQLFRASEIQFLRLLLALAGLVLLLCSCAWLGSAGHKWRTRLESDYETWRSASRKPLHRRRKFTVWWMMLSAVVVLGLFLTMQLSFQYHLTGTRWFDILAVEGGIWETLTAVTLAAAGVFLLLTVRRFGHAFGPSFAKWPAVVLALMFFVGAGEEMNWGQVWLAFDTPEALEAINAQDSFNLHNIDSHLVNHLATLFFLAYGALLPIVALLFSEAAYACDRLNVPLNPLMLVPFVLLGVSMSDHALFYALWGQPPWHLSESREVLLGLVMLGLSVSFYLLWEERAREPSHAA